MNEILYIKYSSERDEHFQIKTTIKKDKMGKLFIEKMALTEKSKKHIDKIYRNGELLKEVYGAQNKNIADCKLSERGIILEYVKGRTFLDELNECVSRKDYSRMKEQLLRYIDFITQSGSLLKSFEDSKPLHDVFGDVSYDNNTKALTLSNVDLLFENIIISEKLTIIDYEWIFDFDIPLEFIFYRSIYYWNDFLNFSEEIKSQIYNIFNINTLKLAEYDAMEQQFQAYVLGKRHSIVAIWETMGRKNTEFMEFIGYRDLYEQSLYRINKLQVEVEERNQHIEKLDGDIIELCNNISDITQERIQLFDDITELTYQGQALKTEMSRQKIETEELLIELNNKRGHIELLLESERELERIKNNKKYQSMLKEKNILNMIFPQDSKQRDFVMLLKRIYNNRRLYLKIVNIKKITKFIYYLLTEDSQRILERFKRYESMHEEFQKKDLELFLENFEETNRIIFEKFQKPLISIVIPVFNQWEYTFSCLNSIFQTVENIPYEIIIADDVSSDRTENIDKYVKNVKVIRNEKNLGFLLNCNNAAKQAEGKYIVFLNNDTNVQREWLSSLIDLIETDELIGMVGSKLIYPDGRLQEAGGIIWDDASGWNYGKRDDPEKSEYNYVKEVDYISGASIMIRKNLWESIGGFDERYVPAYCEDSDLAFEVRKAGFRVLYQPLSVVVHFEGISHGTDENQGLKKYQVENKIKFVEKWQVELEKNHYKNSENVFVARERSGPKRHLLVIDHYVPHFDQDAGSRTVFQYLELLSKLDISIKFIGDNYFRHEPYTKILQQMGIEVLYGKEYQDNWKNWFKFNSQYFDYVWLNRPHISEKYIDFIKSNSTAKIIYYGHDLHFLRDFREYELTGDSEKLKTSNFWKTKEIELIQKADLAIYPSIVEVNEIKMIDDQLNVINVPAYIYPAINEQKYRIEGRSNLMFVGGFRHKPNVDGILWFVNEVMPIITKLMPNIILNILGSQPPEEILKLKSGNVIIHGFVTDEELDKFYNNSKIVIVPLRYGAGIKGKVIEAMYHQVPIITTSIGAEGICCGDEVFAIADQADLFAKNIIDLYNDELALMKYSIREREFINANYSEIAVKKVLKNILS